MNKYFSLSKFQASFPDDEVCLEEIIKHRYPSGTFCIKCNGITKHYKVRGRSAYACKLCRSQLYPLVGTVFEKTSTPLKLWFLAIYYLTQTRGAVSAKYLERELNVTYKTAWRIHALLTGLMEDGTNVKLTGVFDLTDPEADQDNTVRRWSFFNKIEITFSEKKEK